jgi:hypothetical protein
MLIDYVSNLTAHETDLLAAIALISLIWALDV